MLFSNRAERIDGTWSRSSLRAIDEGCTMNRLFQSRTATLFVACGAAGLLGP